MFRDLTKRELESFYECCYCGKQTVLMTYINDGEINPSICIDCACDSADLVVWKHWRALGRVGYSILRRQVRRLFLGRSRLIREDFERSHARCEYRERNIPS